MGQKQSTPEGADFDQVGREEDAASLTFRVIHTTPFARYLQIALWAAMLATLVPWVTALTWCVLTMGAGAARSYFEQRLKREKTAFAKDSQKREYAIVAMASCSFWAVAPILAIHSDSAFAHGAALFFIAAGIMLVLSQFRSTPTNALIVISPYILAYFYLCVSVWGISEFYTYVAAGPVIAACVHYTLIFGYRAQASLDKSAQDRNELIEKLSAARIAAERASEAKSMFLANMSHEIRTPMNGVLGMAELLASTNLDNRQRIFAETIHKSGGALLTIINDILDFSKIEAGKLEFDNGDFDLRASVEDVAALVASRAQEKNLEVIVRFQPDLPSSLIGDGGRIRQVVTNLVGNAIKFTDTGYVLVNVSGEARDEQASIRIEVTDTGVGISPDAIAHIFNAFQQADSSTTRKYGGTGLGLSISNRLVEAMGGKMGVESTLGEGSTFWVELDLPVGNASGISSPVVFDLNERRVLIVDDVEVNRRILTELLQSWGCDTSVAASGKEALATLYAAQAKGDDFDLVILDFHMPEMDGEELARRIKDDPVLGGVKMMALTSVDGHGDARRFREIGVESYLVKPVRGALLFDAMVSTLGNDARAEEPSNAAELARHPAAPSASPIERRRVLLAEDNEVNQLVVRHMLDANHFEIVVAADGREALTQFCAEDAQFDIVLMDVSMPEMDGYEATRAIRQFEQEHERESTPIVCLTAHVLAADIEAAHEAGMDDYLSKPVSKDKLDRAIAQWAHEGRNAEKAAAS